MNPLWESQKIINENTNMQMSLMIQQLNIIISVIEDHENDMKCMADEINRLNKELSELKGERP